MVLPWQRWAWLGVFLVAAVFTVFTWWGWLLLALVTWTLIVAA